MKRGLPDPGWPKYGHAVSSLPDTECHIVADRVVDEINVLLHVTQLILPLAPVQIGQRCAVHRYRTFVRFDQPQQQIDHGTLASTAWSDEPNSLTLADLDGNILQRPVLGIGIFKVNPVKLDFPVKGERGCGRLCFGIRLICSSTLLKTGTANLMEVKEDRNLVKDDSSLGAAATNNPSVGTTALASD